MRATLAPGTLFFFPVLLAVLLVGAPAAAHPLDEIDRAWTLTFRPNSVQLQVKLRYGWFTAGNVFPRIDANRDRRADPAEKRAFSIDETRRLAAFVVLLDAAGRRVPLMPVGGSVRLRDDFFLDLRMRAAIDRPEPGGVRYRFADLSNWKIRGRAGVTVRGEGGAVVTDVIDLPVGAFEGRASVFTVRAPAPVPATGQENGVRKQPVDQMKPAPREGRSLSTAAILGALAALGIAAGWAARITRSGN